MNTVLSKDNHMKIGYNKKSFSYRINLYDKFFVSYGTIGSVPISFRQACIDSAVEISNICQSLNKIPLVMYSGGIDSELIIAAFLESKRDFSVAHVKYTPNFNNHETYYVEQFSKKHDLDLHYFDVDPIEYFTNRNNFDQAVRDNANLIETQLMTSITPMIKDRYFPISDSPGVAMFRTEKDVSKKSKWYWKDYEHLSAYFFHCMKENMPACPSFYHWSPEIILAFLLDPLVIQVVNNDIEGKITMRTTSSKIYNTAFPEYGPFNRPKYNGFEKLPRDMIEKTNRELHFRTFYDRHSGCSFEYNDLIRQLGYHGI